MISQNEFNQRILAAWPKANSLQPDADEIDYYKQKIKKLLIEKEAVLIAHYYVNSTIQSLAEESNGMLGDSLAMARFGQKHHGKTIVVAGVRFMGESAKILSPDKKVLMPTLEAECSLDISCQEKEFKAFIDKYPDRTVVVYVNTSAKIKALADWTVTSSNALEIIDHLDSLGQKILWAPDKHLGKYIQQQTGADMIHYDGACIVHEEFKADAILSLKHIHPDAAILVHPESPDSVVQIADIVGSTSDLLKASQTLAHQKFIVATDQGIFYKMQQQSPNKQFYEAPTAGQGATCKSCAKCPWMAMNTLKNLASCLENETNEILVDTATIQKAMIPLNRMVQFSNEKKTI